MTQALKGVRIADLTWLLAGAGGPRVLAGYGAEVIRVEWKGKLDFLRLGPPLVYKEGETPAPASLGRMNPEALPSVNRNGNFNDINAGKLGISLNLNTERGKEIFKRLVAISDVVVENFSANTMENWGLGYDVLKSIKPDIIYVQASGWGYRGPYQSYQSYGPTAQAISGITYESGLPEPMPPAGWGFSYLDHMGGYSVALAILFALNYRKRTGQGVWMDLAQGGFGIFLTGTAVLDYSANGRHYERTGNASPYKLAAPHNVYPCAGRDRWIAIAVTQDSEWEGLVKAMDSPAWAYDARFATMLARVRHRDELDRLLSEWTKDKEPFELMYLLQSHGVPAGVCQVAQDRVERDPHLRARDYLVTVPHSEMGRWPVQNLPLKLSATPVHPGGVIDRGAPCYGEDNEYVYTKLLGLSLEDLTQLQAEGVI